MDGVIEDSNIWLNDRKRTHAFLLSPDVYHITKMQHDELNKLGSALHDCLLGLSHMATIAYDTDLNYSGAWSLVRKVFSTGVLKVYRDFQGMGVKDIPKLLKVDLMIDQDGNYKIAEIDGHNKHGIGYSTLGLRFREVLHSDKKSLPGVVRLLAEEIKKQGFNKIKILHSNRERFYIPELQIVKQEFIKFNIDCFIISEMELSSSHLQDGLFLDLPFLYERAFLYSEIIDSYKNGKIKFIIPLKPFFGSKGVLALLKNSTKDFYLESILQSFIKASSLAFVRKYIPETFLIGKEAMKIISVEKIISGKRYVLKEAISSGMKGVYFSDEINFKETLEIACNAKMNWVLQEEVLNQPQTFSFFDNGASLCSAKDWFMRITTHYVNRNLADIIITARRDRAVHGAKDCLQIGTVID